jgi:MFS family permease
LLSLFNIGGRFFWASLSDFFGRKTTFVIFFVLGGLLYISIPSSANAGNKLFFVAAFCIILSMYGGGFSTVPAYLADLFGTQMVGAIHGRLLTAWATAGILGPVIVNYMRDYQLSLGLPREQVYNQTMMILAGLLMIGLVCNLLIRPLADKWFMTVDELAEEKQHVREVMIEDDVHSMDHKNQGRNVKITHPIRVWLAWVMVLLPLSWGIYKTLINATKFFID